MEPLTILGAIAAVAQLSKVIHSVGSGVVTLFYHNREIPEKVRRLKSTIQSLKAKLEVLATSFEDLTDKSWLSRDLWDNFNMSLEQVNSDIEAMATIIKNYDTETRKIIRFRKRIRYHISDQRALSKCVQHLESSVKNLQCMENSIHMSMTDAIYQEVRICRKAHHSERPTQHLSHLMQWTLRSRKSLLSSESYVRSHGIYSWLKREARKDDEDSQTTVCFGVCLPPLVLSISLSLVLTIAFLSSQWTLQWGLRVQFRVSITSPLMKACKDGDVTLINQILSDGKGSINDQSMCTGKTPLLVAISGEHFEAVEYLLKNGADPNIPDDDQVLPLFAVAGMDPRAYPPLEQLPPLWEHWLKTFRLLTNYGASVFDTVRDRNLAGLNVERDSLPGRTLEYLRLLSALDSPQLDITLGRECWSALHSAFRCKSDTLDALKLLQSCGVSLSKILEDGRTSLHFAAEMCTGSKTLEFLFANGCKAYLNRQDQWGWTPLHYAAVSRRSAECLLPPYENVVMFLREGADYTLQGMSNAAFIYDQPAEAFTAFELLRHIRPARFLLLEQVLKEAGIEILLEKEENIA